MAEGRGRDRLCAADSELPDFDVQAPLLSLPSIFATILATIPARVPYLQADSRLVEQGRAKTPSVSGFRIGLAWRGNPTHKGDRFRSIPLRMFEPLAR